MESLKETLKKKRDTLSQKSINTYASVLKTIMKDLEMESVDDLDNDKKVMTYLKDMTPNKRKTRLSALFVLTGNDTYKTNMLNDVNKYNESMKSQTKTDKESENWLSKGISV